jgi:hypothetical protein
VIPQTIEGRRIKSAYKAARFMKWRSVALALIAVMITLILWLSTHWYIGLAFLVLSWAALFVAGYSLARCPKCGQVWWSWLALLTIAPWWLVLMGSAEMDDETESLKCRKCKLEIGPALKT